MSTIYCARWILPISSPPLSDGAIVVEGDRVTAIGDRATIRERFPTSAMRDLGEAAILPGLVNAHSHLELTAMRGFLEAEEADFFAWLRKLTIAREERMTADDISVSAAWGACEAARAGVTCFGDSSNDAVESMKVLRDVGLRGTVYQESFGPDPCQAIEHTEKLRGQVAEMRTLETSLVRPGISPHSPYTVSAHQLELIAVLAIADKLPLMMHAAESFAEDCLIRKGTGPFAEGLARRSISWQTPGVSTIEYVKRHGILSTRPLLAHSIRVDAADIESIKESGANIAHCPRSNAKLGHGRAPFAQFLKAGIPVGLGSDSVASNNTCDILAEARFAVLLARAEGSTDELASVNANDVLIAATMGGAQTLGLAGQIGELKAGAHADFIAVSLDGTHQVPVYDPAAALVFASSGRDVIMTVVAGREVYCEGRVTTVDEERLRARMNEIALKLQS